MGNILTFAAATPWLLTLFEPLVAFALFLAALIALVIVVLLQKRKP